MKPQLSIIIPVYNVERYVSFAIDSLLAQEFQNWEAILVDNNSTDASYKICKKYSEKDKRIVVTSEKIGGVSNARNKGLSIAKGDYIAFLDADDFVSPTYYLDAVNAIKMDNTEIAFLGYTIFHDKTKMQKVCLKRKILAGKKGISLCYKPSSSGLFVWNKIFKRNIVNDIRFDARYIIGEDAFWLMNVLQNAKTVTCVSNSGYYYRQNREGSAVYTGKKNRRKESSWSRLLSNYQCYKLLNRTSHPSAKNALRRSLFSAKDLVIDEYLTNKGRRFTPIAAFLFRKYISYSVVVKDLKFIMKFLLIYILVVLRANKNVVSHISKLH